MTNIEVTSTPTGRVYDSLDPLSTDTFYGFNINGSPGYFLTVILNAPLPAGGGTVSPSLILEGFADPCRDPEGCVVAGDGRSATLSASAAPLPEPSTLLLLALGAGGAIARRRRS